MSFEISLIKSNSVANSELDVVFIHGLNGDPKKTWTTKGGEFWPNWLGKEFSNVAIYSIGYRSRFFNFLAKPEKDIFELAISIMNYILSRGIGDRPIIFISHSLGGILTKLMLRKSCDSEDKKMKKLNEKVQLVVFLSTPHTRVSLASSLKTGSDHNIIKFLNIFLSLFRRSILSPPKTLSSLSSKYVEFLANDPGILEDLNAHYRFFANTRSNLKTAVFYEKYKTYGTLIISRESADPGVSGTIPVAVDKNHINICKPRNYSDPVYVGIVDLIYQTLQTCKSPDTSV